MTETTPREILRVVAREFGTPCFVYFLDQIRERVALVRNTFGTRFQISYAIKSNPNPGLLRHMKDMVEALDVSSGGEVSRALSSGWRPSQISFTGPGKTDAELRKAVESGIGEVVVESIEEASLLSGIARAAGKTQAVLVRIAPRRTPRGFGLSMTGKSTQFGIDEEEVEPSVATIQALPHLELCGFHIYSGTQCLSPESLVENYEIFIDIFRRICDVSALTPRKLVFGSGIGIPYYENTNAVDLAAVGHQVNPALDAFKRVPRFSETSLVLETGRYLVGEAGIYVTRVLRNKQSRGTVFCVCDGGMNHHLGAAGHLGTVVPRNYRMFQITEERGGQQQEYTLVGPLCTTIDTLGRQVKLRGIEAGDLIGIHCSGAYGVTASPIHFIGHEPPKEIIVATSAGEMRFEDATQFRDCYGQAEGAS